MDKYRVCMFSDGNFTYSIDRFITLSLIVRRVRRENLIQYKNSSNDKTNY